MSASPSRSNKLLSISLRLLIAAALLGFLFASKADLAKVAALLKGVSVRWLSLSLFVAVSGEILTAYKWRRLISFIGGNLPILKAIRASFIGMFYNNFFPGSVGGDIARVLLVAREAGGKARATASAFMQRNTGLAALFFVGIPASFIWPRHFDWPGTNSNSSLAILTDCRLWLIAAAAGFFTVNAALFSKSIYHKIWVYADHEEETLRQGRLHQLIRTVLRKLQRFHAELRGYRFWLPAPLFISVVTQLSDIFMIWSLSKGLGLDVPFHVFLVTVPMVSIGNLIPITVNGIGLRETLYVALLHSAGLAADQAIAISLLQFAIMMALAAAGGIIHLATPASTAAVSPDR